MQNITATVVVYQRGEYVTIGHPIPFVYIEAKDKPVHNYLNKAITLVYNDIVDIFEDDWAFCEFTAYKGKHGAVEVCIINNDVKEIIVTTKLYYPKTIDIQRYQGIL